MRRRTMLGSAGALLSGLHDAAAQEAYPSRPIRAVIPFPPGGPTDIVARVLGERMARDLRQPLVIENRAGANGNIGNEAVAKAEPDGYTILFNTSSIALSRALYPRLAYDALRDLAPVALTATIPLVIAINPTIPVRSIAEFIAYIRARPGQISHGSSGNGNVTHLAAAQFLRANGLEAIHAPYRGSAPALTDAAAGTVHFVMDTVNSALPLIQDGRLRALAVSSARRIGPLPEVPTLAETVMPGFEVGAWYGLMVPARCPPAVVPRLNAALLTALRDPDVLGKLAAQGTEPLGGTPEEYGAYLRAEIERWARVVAEAGVRLE